MSNKEPTVCINTLANELGMNPISREVLLARIFNNLESYLKTINEGSEMKHIFEKYHQYWLHNNQQVKIEDENCKLKNGTVMSLDDDGYLKVQVDGRIVSVHPDGNSFDMLQGLIIPKK